jgi:hypothetical protein
MLSDMTKLNAVVVAEKSLAARQSNELSRWQESVTALRAENGQMRGEMKRAEQLQHDNETLNNELNNVRANVEEEVSGWWWQKCREEKKASWKKSCYILTIGRKEKKPIYLRR